MVLILFLTGYTHGDTLSPSVEQMFSGKIYSSDSGCKEIISVNVWEICYRWSLLWISAGLCCVWGDRTPTVIIITEKKIINVLDSEMSPVI